MTNQPNIEHRYRALVHAMGQGFHPDTRAEDYTSLPDGYTAEQVDAIVVEAFAAELDVYGIALDIFHGEQFPATEPITLGDVRVGDRVIRPHFGTVETVATIGRDPYRGPRTRFLCMTYESGESWTNTADYPIERVVAS